MLCTSVSKGGENEKKQMFLKIIIKKYSLTYEALNIIFFLDLTNSPELMQLCSGSLPQHSS